MRTKGKWIANVVHLIGDSGKDSAVGFTILASDQFSAVAVATNPVRGDPSQYAEDAAFICRADRHYDALVECLEGLINKHLNGGIKPDDIKAAFTLVGQAKQ